MKQYRTRNIGILASFGFLKERQGRAYILLFLWLIPSLAIWGCLHYQREVWREEVKHQLLAGIDRQELVLLSFSTEEARQQIRWEEDREFEYQGRWYDVVEAQAQGDSLHYWCWLDQEETDLSHKIQQALRSNAHPNPEQATQEEAFLQFLKQLWLASSQASPIAAWRPSHPIRPVVHARLSCHFISPPAPPPKQGWQ